MSTQPKPTWEQVLAMPWHPCDLATHTIAECRADLRQHKALVWGSDVLSFCAVYAVLFTVIRPIERAIARRQVATVKLETM